MKVATLKEAQAHLSELVTLAQQGETVIIEHDGKPAVRLNPVAQPDLELTAAELRELDAWADKERAAGRTRVFESPAAYVAQSRAKRAGQSKSR